MPNDTEEIIACVWEKAEQEGLVRTNQKGEKVIYVDRNWLIQAFSECKKELGDDAP